MEQPFHFLQRVQNSGNGSLDWQALSVFPMTSFCGKHGRCFYSRVAMKKHLLMLCFAFLLLPAAWAQKNYETTYKLTCGPTEVTLTNTCTMITKSDPFCSRQKLEFLSTQTGKKAEQVYLPKYRKYFPQAFIAQLTCLKNKNAYYTRASITSYPGCLNGEWEDIFDGNGKYVGSTRMGIMRAFTRSFKRLPNGFFDVFDYDHFIDNVNIFITPVQQE